jgi:hypothetical protein
MDERPRHIACMPFAIIVTICYCYGLYPAIILLWLVALIPIASKFYVKKITSKANDFQRNYYNRLTIINLLSILVVLWMTFVIVHDRVLHDG